MSNDVSSDVSSAMPAHDRWSPYPTRVAARPAVLPRVDPVIWGSGHTGPLRTDEIAQYATDGFLSIEQLVEPSLVATLRHEVERLCATIDPFDERRITEPGNDDVRSLFAVHELSDVFAELLTSSPVTDPVRQILGDDIYIHQSRINRKPGFRGKEFGWHSDFETWHAEDGMPRMRAVSVSIALTENRPDNGSLMIVRGSHRHFVSCVGATPDAHYRTSLQNQMAGVPDEATIAQLAELGGITTCIGPPGSATFFDCSCMHGSNGNITPYGRSNVFVVYNSIDNELEEPFRAPAPRPTFLAQRSPAPI